MDAAAAVTSCCGNSCRDRAPPFGIVSGALLPRPLPAFVAAAAMLSSFSSPQQRTGSKPLWRIRDPAFRVHGDGCLGHAAPPSAPAARPDMEMAARMMLTLWWAVVVGLGACGAIRFMLVAAKDRQNQRSRAACCFPLPPPQTVIAARPAAQAGGGIGLLDVAFQNSRRHRLHPHQAPLRFPNCRTDPRDPRARAGLFSPSHLFRSIDCVSCAAPSLLPAPRPPTTLAAYPDPQVRQHRPRPAVSGNRRQPRLHPARAMKSKKRMWRFLPGPAPHNMARVPMRQAPPKTPIPALIASKPIAHGTPLTAITAPGGRRTNPIRQAPTPTGFAPQGSRPRNKDAAGCLRV